MAVLVIFAAISGILVVTGLSTSAQQTSGLNTATGYNVGSGVQSVWEYNSSAHTWYQTTFTVSANKESLTFAVPAGRNVSEILIFTQNSSQNVYNLLQNGLVYTYSNLILTKGTHATYAANLTSVYMFFGTALNASGTTSLVDKQIVDYALAQPLYTSTQNNLGQTVQLSTISMFAGNMGTGLKQLSTSGTNGATAQYAIYLTADKNTTANGYSLNFTQYFEKSVQIPMVDYVAGIAFFITLLAAVVIYWFGPTQFARDDTRAGRALTRKEMPLTVVGIIGLLALLLVVGLLGMYSPIGGWGAAVAVLAGFSLFVYAYTERPSYQKYSSTVFMGLLGGAIFFLINMFLPFGSIYFSLLNSLNVLGVFASLAVMVVLIFMAADGLMNTKRRFLRPRNASKMSAEGLKKIAKSSGRGK